MLIGERKRLFLHTDEEIDNTTSTEPRLLPSHSIVCGNHAAPYITLLHIFHAVLCPDTLDPKAALNPV